LFDQCFYHAHHIRLEEPLAVAWNSLLDYTQTEFRQMMKAQDACDDFQ